jgi:hypothetical protein
VQEEKRTRRDEQQILYENREHYVGLDPLGKAAKMGIWYRKTRRWFGYWPIRGGRRLPVTTRGDEAAVYVLGEDSYPGRLNCPIDRVPSLNRDTERPIANLRRL